MARRSNSQAQGFSTERWTARDGLPDSTVLSIAQTPDGALWVGTRLGLARFDGTQFTVSAREQVPNLGSNVINNMAVGSDAQLYAGTDNGLIVVSHGRPRSFGQREGVEQSRVMVVLPVGEDDAWFGNISGHLYHYLHGSISQIGAAVFSHEPVYGLAMAPDGTLWVGTGTGLFAFRNGTISRYKPRIALPVVAIFDLALSPQGSLFAASDGGLFEIEGDHWKSWTVRSGLPSNALNVLAMGPSGVLWIGSKRGMARLADGVVQPVRSVTCNTNSLFVDKEKSLWIGCDDGQGLTRITAGAVSFLSVPRVSDPSPVSSLVEDQTGAVWIGSSRGLFRYKNQRFKQYTRKDGLPGSGINAISLSSAGVLWIATDDGLARLQNGHFQSIRTKRAGLLEPYFSVFEDRKRTLWATSDRGLLRRRLGQTTFEDVPEAMNSMWSLHEDHEGALWVATSHHGLGRLAGNIMTTFNTACGVASDTVYDSAQDASGATWALTAGGLSRIRGARCATIGPKNGLPADKPGSLVFDRRGYLWLRTRDGIAALDIAEADYVIDHGGTLRKSRYFGRDDGFGDALSDSPVWNRILLRSSGDIWLPTVAGVAILSATILQADVPQQRPQVTSVISDSGEHDLSAPVKVQPSDLHLQFAYSAPYLLGAKNREYRYRLSGFDQDWQNGGKRKEAVYTSLPHGKYHFQISARLPFGPWSEASAPIELIVLPHLYQTWWWYTLMALLSLTMIMLGYRSRLITVRRQYVLIMAERTRERSRLARELHDTLSRGMMAIHAHIQLARALLRIQPESACSHLETAASIARDSASETRRCIAALRSEIDEHVTLRDTLNQAIAKFKESCLIPLAVIIDDDLPVVSEEVSHEIVRVAEEALTNVRLHSGAEQAYFFARRSGKCLLIEVLDNGRGFEWSHSGHARPDHFGFTGMKERAQRIHGILTTKSVPGEGTNVLLQVPLNTKVKRKHGQSYRH